MERFLESLQHSFTRFVFDGQRVKENDTPKSLEMENDDTIEVFTQQSGGFKKCRALYKTPLRTKRKRFKNLKSWL